MSAAKKNIKLSMKPLAQRAETTAAEGWVENCNLGDPADYDFRDAS